MLRTDAHATLIAAGNGGYFRKNNFEKVESIESTTTLNFSATSGTSGNAKRA